MKTERALVVPSSLPASPQLADVYGFTLYAASADVSPSWPLSARVEYEDGATESLTVREGTLYSTGRKIRRAWFTATTAGAVDADVTLHAEDIILGPTRPLSPRWLAPWTLTKSDGNYQVGDGVLVGSFVRPAGYSRFRLYQNTAGVPTNLYLNLYGKGPNNTRLRYHSTGGTMFGSGDLVTLKPVVALGNFVGAVLPAAYAPTVTHYICPDAFDFYLYGTTNYTLPIAFAACWEP